MGKFEMSMVNTAPIEYATKAISDSDLLHKNYWFNHMRLRLVQHVINTSRENHSKASLLDFGCGKGIQLAQLKESHPLIDYVGYEPYLKSDQVDNSIPLFKSLSNLAGRKFDFITALDVIEHIEDDLQALREMHSLLTERGVVLIHVPAYMHLWCPTDSIYGHYRRYCRESLIKVVEAAGFKTVEAFYVYPYAYPVFILRRYVYRILDFLGSNHDENTVMKYLPTDPLKIPSMLAALELKFIKKTSLRSPFGSSIFLYAIKV